MRILQAEQANQHHIFVVLDIIEQIGQHLHWELTDVLVAAQQKMSAED